MNRASKRLTEDFPVILELPVVWGEMDAMGHVNNTVYFRYFESVRIAYLERVGFLEEMRTSGVGPILASTQCKFRAPLTYPDRIHVGARAGEPEADRFLMHYGIASENLGVLAAEGSGLIVAYDYGSNRKAALPDSVRAAITALESR